MVQWDIESLVQVFDPSYTRSGYKVKKLQVFRLLMREQILIFLFVIQMTMLDSHLSPLQIQAS